MTKKRESNPASLFFPFSKERERTHAHAQRDDIVERKKRGDDEEEERDAPPPPPILLPKPLKLLSRERRKRGIPNSNLEDRNGIHFGET